MDNLKELICSMINSFLGPNKSNKFLIQDKDVCVTRCPLSILQSNHLKDPISVLVEETLFAHHEFYGCSTLSLITMWYFWKEEFRFAIEDGCKMQSIVKHSQDMLELAISALSDVKVSVDRMLVPKKHCPTIVASQNPAKKMNDFNQIPISIRYSSRHFSPSSQNLLNSEDQNGQFNKYSEADEKCLEAVVQSLNHDEDIQISELVLECWKKQMTYTNCIKFQRDGLLICPIILPRCNSTVVDGLIVKSNLNRTCYQDMKNGDTNRTLIIMGSITYKYAHLGFAPKVAISVQTCNMTVINKEEQWKKMCCDLIMQLNVNVLLAKDDIDEEIASFCFAHGVLAFPHIPLKVFKILCNALQYSPCTYLWDCKEENIIKNLIIKEWKPRGHPDGSDQYFLFDICLKSTLPLQTVVICHPSPTILEMLKHQMQHLLSRLNLTLQSGSLLPGGGEAEKSCSDFLRKHSQFQNLSDQATRITTALINGYQNYTSVVTGKRALSGGNTTKMMDEMSSKVNAWRSALSLVLLTLQCDTVIINGIGDLQKGVT